MKASISVVTSAVLWLSNSVAIASDTNDNSLTISQSTVTVSTDADGGQVQATTVSVDRADLTEPHILRVQGSANDEPVRLQRVEVKINGRLVRSVSNNSLELNLAPLLKSGSYEVEISATSLRPEDAISVSFNGKSTNVTQQFAGAGTIKQKLVINVR